jgi:ammonia channel protein AmtB
LNAKLIGYWTTTAIIAFVLLSGGVADLLRPQAAVEGMTALGYPLYFMTILGVWKILGGIVLVGPRLARLKEWAYAGAFFDFTGATASHVSVGDNAFHIITPLLIAAILLASWALRPPSRVLGVLLPAKG